MKKIIKAMALGMSLLAVTALVVGCGSKDKSATTTSGSDTTTSSANSGEIKVAINNNVTPFSYMKDGKIVGAEVDIWNYIGKELDKEIVFDPAGFDVLFGKIDNKEDDFLSSYLAINPTRQEKYNFTEPYAHGFMKLLVLKSTNDIDGLKDCGGKKVAVTATSNAREFLERYIEEEKVDIEPVYFEDKDSAAAALNSGDVVGFFEGAGTNIALIQSGVVDGKFVGKSEDITDTAFLYRKGDAATDELADQVSDVIVKMKENGKLTEIYEKWVGVDITDPSADMTYITK